MLSIVQIGIQSDPQITTLQSQHSSCAQPLSAPQLGHTLLRHSGRQFPALANSAVGAEAVDDVAVPHKLGYPANGHHAPLDVGKVFVVAHQVLLVPGVVLDALVVLDAFENDLAKAVKVGQVVHLVVVELVHHGARFCGVVDLVGWLDLWGSRGSGGGRGLPGSIFSHHT